MRWLRYPRTPLEMLIAGAAMLAVTVVLLSIMITLFATAGAFAAAGGVLVLIFIWDFAVERPKRQARRAEALASQNRPIDDIPLRTEAGHADWSDRLPGPLGAVARTAPATLAALLIIGGAVAINGLLGGFITSESEDGVYVRLQTGAFGDIQQEGDRTRSLRVTLLGFAEWTEQPPTGRKYWAVEVTVENIGMEAMPAPTWKLRVGGREYDPTTASAPGPDLGDQFTLSRGDTRTGWVVFKSHVGVAPQWLRAHVPGYPPLYFASRTVYEEKERTSPWDRPGEWR